MIFFYYGFGLALSIALTIATGSAWIREHRNGRWDNRSRITLALVAIVLGILVGWGLQEWLSFAFATQTQRGY
jgi:Na+-driven multidrug efflux pump